MADPEIVDAHLEEEEHADGGEEPAEEGYPADAPVSIGAAHGIAIEYAKSGRSSCKEPKCKGPIAKGELRFVQKFTNESMGVDMSKNFHPSCFLTKMMPRAKAWRLTKGDDIPGFEALQATDQEAVVALLAEGAGLCAGVAAAKAAKASGVKVKKPRKKKTDEDDEDEDEEEVAPAAGKRKKAAGGEGGKAKRARKDEGDDGDEEEEEDVAGGGASGPLSGQVFVFAGFADPKLEAAIKGAGGDVIGNVTKKCTSVVTKGDGSGAAAALAAGTAPVKVRKAAEAGLTLMPAAELCATLGVERGAAKASASAAGAGHSAAAHGAFSAAGQVAVFTGFRDKGLEAALVAAGASVAAAGMNKTVTLVVCKDGAQDTAKVQAAVAKGLRVMTGPELEEALGRGGGGAGDDY